jgi:5-oxoprolinase (ATP-hydrolysing)
VPGSNLCNPAAVSPKPGHFAGKDAILSGPAGGVVGMVAASAPHWAEGEVQRLIGFDMGGTSTDVSHYAGRYELGDENLIAGVRIRAPMMQIHTIAAGGGSICRFDGMRFRVGPESAGARPGPACYRAGGPLTVTDCNLLLGRISPQNFPAVFGSEGDQMLDPEASRPRLQEVADALAEPRASERSPKASCTSPSTIWPPRSARSRSPAAMT